MPKRFLLLLAVFLLVGIATRAFRMNAQAMGEVFTFHNAPSNPYITRAGAVALFIESRPELAPRLALYRKHMPPMALFSDIDQKEWYSPYLEVAFEQGIIKGNSDRTFRPGQLLAVEEGIAMAARYKEAFDTSLPLILTIGQATTNGNWLNQTITTAQSYNLALPNPVSPGTPISRGDLFTMLKSAGIASPETIAINGSTVGPAVAIVPIAQNTQPRAVTYTAPQQQVYRAPVVAQQQRAPQYVAQVPTPQQQPVQQGQTTTHPYASTKNFAITMPSLGITDLSISHPADPFSHDGMLAPLKYGVGHLFGFPGGGGKILVYGHSSSYSWDISKYTKIFRQINKLNVGDKVYVTYSGKMYVYQVTFKNSVPAADMSSYKGSGGEELILYTCWPPDSIKERYLVHATPVETIALNK